MALRTSRFVFAGNGKARRKHPFLQGVLLMLPFAYLGFRALGLGVGISCHGSGLGVLGRSRGKDARD